jgi:hypothetical protein
MKEDFLYFIWKYKLFQNHKLFDLPSEKFRILSPGKQNLDSGPDFFEAKIKTDGTVLVGNVEIHLKSSDWYKHGHHTNKDYNNVILHVVRYHDKETLSENGRKIPVLQPEISQAMVEKYHDYQKNKSFIPCAKDIAKVNQFKISMWLGMVLFERLSEKTDLIQRLLTLNKNDWEETFYQLIARGFGFNVNTLPFELLAKSLPQRILAKHHHNLFQLEALLLGQAGFLEKILVPDEYYNRLKKEYDYLRKKYRLKPVENHLWKFLRIRPSGFPTIRISQFADLVHKSSSLFSKMVESESVEQIKSFLQVQASEYWKSHYQFEKLSAFKIKVLGKQSVDLLIINTIIPMIFVHGVFTGRAELKEKAIGFMDQLTAEDNSIVKNWVSIGVQAPSAFYSQALIYQKKVYCSKIRCLECGIGVEIFRMSDT